MGKIPEQILADIKACVPISDIIGPHVSWDKGKSNPSRGEFWACCPFHQEKTPSFKADNQRGRYHCFGCGASGDHFRFLTETQGLHFLEAVRSVAVDAGVDLSPWTGEGRQMTAQECQEWQERRSAREARQREREREAALQAAEKASDVRAIWQASVPIDGTLAERYLMGRGIPRQTWPPSLRFNSGLFHPFEKRKFPCLVGAVQNIHNKLTGLWRIYLDPDTAGKAQVTCKQGVKIGMGPCRGGAVRLGNVWAALSTSGMMSVEIPEGFDGAVCEGIETGFGVKALWQGQARDMRGVRIYADGDLHKFKGGQISGPVGVLAMQRLIRRLVEEGHEVKEMVAPDGMDWLDVWNYASEPHDEA